MSAKRYTPEQKEWYFRNIVDKGIPPTGKQALAILKEEWGKAPSRSSLQGWVDPSQAQKTLNRTRKYRKENAKVIVGKRLDQFRKHTPPTRQEVAIKDKARAKERGLFPTLIYTVNNRITRFQAKGTKMDKILLKNCDFLAADLLKQLEETQNYNPETHDCVCMICGDSLNLINDTWHMDHIDPHGDNSKENASCVHSTCNQVKSYLSMEELLTLSKKISTYHESK